MSQDLLTPSLSAGQITRAKSFTAAAATTAGSGIALAGGSYSMYATTDTDICVTQNASLTMTLLGASPQPTSAISKIRLQANVARAVDVPEPSVGGGGETIQYYLYVMAVTSAGTVVVNGPFSRGLP